MLGEGTTAWLGKECSPFAPWVVVTSVVFMISVEETRIASNLDTHALILFLNNVKLEDRWRQ